MIFAFFSFFFALVYAALMALYRLGWHLTPGFRLPDDFEPATRVTVIIPARDEAVGITACLQAILEGSFPHHLLEIIVVDDFSEDETAAVALGVLAARRDSLLQYKMIRLKEILPPAAKFTANKKKALEMAVSQAAGALIVTTDADCIAGPDWLRYLAAAAGGGPERVVTAPVLFHREQNAFQRFQALDFLGLMGITGAGIRLGFQRMGNGANLAYPKSLFEATGGYAGNENIASGDDVFLIQKFEKLRSGCVFFLKNPGASVYTEAQPDWRAFVQQRLRWGTKNAALPEWPLRLALAAVLLFCCSIAVNFFWAVFEGFAVVFLQNENGFYLPAGILTLQLALKATFDWFFLNDLCSFFQRKELMKGFGRSFLLHIPYIVWVGLGSLFLKKYTWKGQRTGFF